MEAFINSVIERAKPIIESVLAELGYELVDIEFKTLYGEKHLIVYIACEHGISLDDCERVSNALDAPLDAADPTGNSPYCLDVSSPGLDRPFKTQRDFERNYGTEAEVKLFAPLPGSKDKTIVGTLIRRTDEETVVESNGGEISVKNSLIALVRPYIDF